MIDIIRWLGSISMTFALPEGLHRYVLQHQDPVHNKPSTPTPLWILLNLLDSARVL